MNDEQLSENGVDASEDDRVIPKQYLVPFILVTTLFALWGFANNFTDPMGKVFKDVFAISNAQSAVVQMAFYGGYATMAISASMSLMFPTIYGLALEGIGEDAKLGSAGLIVAIVGAVWLTGFQGMILDLESFMGTTATRGSFYLRFGCFVIVAIYGFLCRNPKKMVAAT